MTQNSLVKPSQLSQIPAVVNFEVPDYSFEGQHRWNETLLMAGKYTGSSIQTFDSKGKPNDSRSDNND